jgi:hypothetical protein
LPNGRRRSLRKMDESGVCGTEREGSPRNPRRREFVERKEREICGTGGERSLRRRG